MTFSLYSMKKYYKQISNFPPFLLEEKIEEKDIWRIKGRRGGKNEAIMWDYTNKIKCHLSFLILVKYFHSLYQN